MPFLNSCACTSCAIIVFIRRVVRFKWLMSRLFVMTVHYHYYYFFLASAWWVFLFFSRMVHYSSIVSEGTGSIVGASLLMTDPIPSSGCSNGFLGIGPLYGFNRNPLNHLSNTSLASMSNWYDPLNSLVIQYGPVQRNLAFPASWPSGSGILRRACRSQNPSRSPVCAKAWKLFFVGSQALIVR